MTACRHTPRAAAVAVAVLIVAGCGGDRDEATTGSPATSIPSTGIPSTPSAPGTSLPATSSGPFTSSTPSTTDQPGTTDRPGTTAEAPSVCALGLTEMLAVVDDSIAAARLEPGGAWTSETATSTFDDRTHTAAEFGYRMGLECTARLTQTTPGGDDRLVLAAWTGERRGWVVQASDPPAEPYRPEQRVQLFIDQPDGEWLVDQSLWAGAIATGETVIVGTVDAPFAVAAKSWWAEVPRFDDLPVSNEAEQYAIDTLVAAGARNVSVAEPASFQSEMGAIQFVTPLGLHLVATVAPPDRFDPAAPIVDGEMVVQQVDGIDVYVTTAATTSYAVASVGWTCGDHVWFIDSSYGTVDELRDWAAHVIATAGC